MRHTEALTLLSDFAADSLDPSRRAAVTEHVDGCAHCREWLADYRALSDALGSVPGNPEAHPDSELLAAWAIQTGDLDDAVRERLEHHAASCPECRRVMDIVPEAVFEAKRPLIRPNRPSRLRGPARRRTLRRLALAAGLAVLLLGAGSLLMHSGTGQSRPVGATHTASAAASTPQGPSDHHLSGIELEGTHLIQAARQLTLTDVKVASGAKITLRAGEKIAFGDGVQIGSGSAVAIEISGETPATDRRHRRSSLPGPGGANRKRAGG